MATPNRPVPAAGAAPPSLPVGVPLPPEVAAALGLAAPQPTWQKYAPGAVFLAGVGFLAGGTIMGIRWRNAAQAEEDANGGGGGGARKRAPLPPPRAAADAAAGDAAATLPAGRGFSPAVLAGKALLYGTALAVGGTAAGVGVVCWANDVRRVRGARECGMGVPTERW
jgi:hypothetical protein